MPENSCFIYPGMVSWTCFSNGNVLGILIRGFPNNSVLWKTFHFIELPSQNIFRDWFLNTQMWYNPISKGKRGLHCYFVKDEIRLEPDIYQGMNLISGRQVVCLCNGRNKTVPWQEYINPAKEQFLSCPKAIIQFFPAIDPEKSWHILWSLNFISMCKSQAGEVVESMLDKT